jgi:hypothetical protein
MEELVGKTKKLKSCTQALHIDRNYAPAANDLAYLISAARIWIQLSPLHKSLDRRCLILPALACVYYHRACMDSPQICSEKPYRKLLRTLCVRYGVREV